MQIPSVPPPLITNPLPQDLVTKTLAHVQTTAPLEQRAVSPSDKYQKSHQNRSNQDRKKGGDQNPQSTGQKGKEKGRGHSVNIDV